MLNNISTKKIYVDIFVFSTLKIPCTSNWVKSSLKFWQKLAVPLNRYLVGIMWSYSSCQNSLKQIKVISSYQGKFFGIFFFKYIMQNKLICLFEQLLPPKKRKNVTRGSFEWWLQKGQESTGDKGVKISGRKGF